MSGRELAYSLYFHEFLEALDVWRGDFNRLTYHLESWQIVSYVIAAALLCAWISKILTSDLSIFARLRFNCHAAIRRLPWVKPKFAQIIAVARNHFEEDLHQDDYLREFYKFIPERGISTNDIVREAREYSIMGLPLLRSAKPQNNTSDVSVTAEEVLDTFKFSNSTSGLRKMEAEIIKMIAAMFHAPYESFGELTGGNFHAALLVCCAAQRRALKIGIEHPEVLLPQTADPVFIQAATIVGLRISWVEVDSSDKINKLKLRRNISSSAALVVAATPNKCTGAMDDIREVAEVAQEFKIPLHVDASLGGFLLPFLEFSGVNCPPFDFRLSGVASIAVDLHRHGQCPREGSVVLFKNSTWISHTAYIHNSAKYGLFTTRAFRPTRDTELVVSAWSTLLCVGRDGYIDATSSIVEATRYLEEALQNQKGIKVIGSADLCLVSFAALDIETYALGQKLIEQGWELELGRNYIRLIVTGDWTKERINSFISDLEDAKVEFLVDSSYTAECKNAALRRMVDAATDQWLVEEIIKTKLLAEHSMPPPVKRPYARSVSVDGRKISTIDRPPSRVEP